MYIRVYTYVQVCAAWSERSVLSSVLRAALGYMHTYICICICIKMYVCIYMYRCVQLVFNHLNELECCALHWAICIHTYVYVHV